MKGLFLVDERVRRRGTERSQPSELEKWSHTPTILRMRSASAYIPPASWFMLESLKMRLRLRQPAFIAVFHFSDGLLRS